MQALPMTCEQPGRVPRTQRLAPLAHESDRDVNSLGVHPVAYVLWAEHEPAKPDVGKAVVLDESVQV